MVTISPPPSISHLQTPHTHACMHLLMAGLTASHFNATYSSRREHKATELTLHSQLWLQQTEYVPGSAKINNVSTKNHRFFRICSIITYELFILTK